MRTGIIATIITASFAASCAIKVQVKKDAKNAGLASSSADMNISASKDFLKQLDGLRTTAADLIVKELAQHDYVGAFRSAVRKYRTFIIEKANKPIIITDSFYSETAKQCRSSGLSLNADDNNEMLGMILKTVVLAKLSEADVSKINAGLAKEMQAVNQFITMELGVDIQGQSSASEENGIKTTTGNVTIKLKPIADEKIDAQTKRDDEVQVLTLNFERALGADNIGTFVSTIDLAYEKNGQPSEAAGAITVSRVKESDQHVHDILMSMGVKGETPSYTREVIVRDNKSDSMKYEFVDVLNAGSTNEARYQTVIDLKAGTQCKGSFASDEKTGTPVKSPEPVAKDPGITTPATPATPAKDSPSQTPVQSKTKSPVQSKL
jgi:hypothetical protein